MVYISSNRCNWNGTNLGAVNQIKESCTERGAAVCWNYEVRSGAVQQDDAVKKSDVVLATVHTSTYPVHKKYIHDIYAYIYLYDTVHTNTTYVCTFI